MQRLIDDEAQWKLSMVAGRWGNEEEGGKVVRASELAINGRGGFVGP